MDTEQTTEPVEKGQEWKEAPQTILVKAIEGRRDFKLWKTHSNIGYATFHSGKAFETWPISSKNFESLVRKVHMNVFKNVSGLNTIKAVVEEFEARAIDAPTLDTNVRVARFDGDTYIDLGDETWQVIKINRDGWSIEKKAPKPFTRIGATFPLYKPIRGGSIDLLRKYINYGSEEQFKLTVGFLLSSLHKTYEYPILAIGGAKDSGKTTFTEILRELLDGHGERTSQELPHNVRDMGVGAKDIWCVAYDNVSKVSPTKSDALCRLSTGFTVRERKYFTNGESFEYTIYRPVILNGIPTLVSKTDLGRRTLFINCPPVNNKQSGSALRTSFERDAPLIFGALLDAIVLAMRRYDEVEPDCPQGLYEVVKWVEAAAPSFGWEEGEFSTIYTNNRLEFMEDHIESNNFSRALVHMIETEGNFYGDFEEFSKRIAMHTKGNTDILPANGKAWVTMLNTNKQELEQVNNIVVNEMKKDPKTRRRRFEIAKVPEDNRNFV